MVRVLVATAVREALPEAAWFGSGCSDSSGAGAENGTPAAAQGAAAAEADAGDHGCTAAAGPAAAAGGWDAGGLLAVAASRDRRVSAAPAPAEGLLFLEAGYSPLPA